MSKGRITPVRNLFQSFVCLHTDRYLFCTEDKRRREGERKTERCVKYEIRWNKARTEATTKRETEHERERKRKILKVSLLHWLRQRASSETRKKHIHLYRQANTTVGEEEEEEEKSDDDEATTVFTMTTDSIGNGIAVCAWDAHIE